MSGPSVGSLLVSCLLFAAVGLRSSGEPPGCPAAAAAAPAPAALGGSRVFSAYFRKLTRQRRAIVGSPGRGSAPRGPVEHLSPQELFIAVKSTRRYHEQRLGLLLDTWISRNMQQTYVFTDGEDDTLRKRLGAHLINTNCSAAHHRQALSCKMAQEYDAFIRSGKKWFCHVDDDNYLNVGALLKLLSRYSHAQDVYLGRPSLERPIQAAEQISTGQMRQVSFWFATGGAGFCLSQGLALKMKPWARTFVETAEHISLPDDCTVGYIVEALLGVSLTRSPLFHSHLENLDLVSDIHSQVTLSYGTAENRRNTVNIRGGFSSDEDPTRFRSVHCLLYPDTTWCLGSQQV